MLVVLSLVVCLVSILPVLSLNILVWNPTTGQSHVSLMGNMADILARDGHNVTVLSPIIDPDIRPFGSKESTVHKIDYRSKFSTYNELADVGAKNPEAWLVHPDVNSLNGPDWMKFMDISVQMCRGMVSDSLLIQSMRDSKFDLGLLEAFDLCSVGMMEVFGIKKTIVAGALGNIPYHNDVTGLPTFTSYIPGFMTLNGDDMTFWERVNNYKFEEDIRKCNQITEDKLMEVFASYDPNFPHVTELLKRQTNFIFSNTNEFTESPRPTSNMVKYIGGATVYPPGNLRRELDVILSTRKQAVLFSMGSYCRSCDMPNTLKQEFLDAFSEFRNVNFIWKYENCDDDVIDFSKYKNVHRMAWVPQTDLLADPRVALFITHAGMNSMVEAAIRGKPLITIPMFADQIMNSRNAVNRGLAIQLKRRDLSKVLLVESITAILNPKGPYQAAAALAASVLEGESEAARERIRRWSRLVGEIGPLEHLPLRTRDMNTIQLYNLDVLAYLFVLRMGPVVAIILTIRIIFMWFTRKSKTE